MKTDDKVRQYRSNVIGTKVRMGIAEGAEAHVMEVLTKMYSDPELAVIREYSTNARDSHIEAGQERPIEVTLPTPYLPTLVIRDYGIGLDEQGIIELYSQYGASSKRSSNEVQGMLGIGCKSALAYTDQFTIVGYKGGVKTQVLISRDEDGAATQTIVGVDTGQYDDGVEVTIPVKSDNSIVEKAHDFFRFWPPRSVMLKTGDTLEEPRPIGQEDKVADGEGGEFRNIWLDDRTLLTNEVDEDLVVMGYVAYPLVDGDEQLFSTPNGRRVYTPQRGHHYTNSFNAVCFVDIGEVNFAPSRESLMTTKRTKDKLAELRQHVKDTFDASVRKQIADAADAKQAQKLLLAGRQMGFDDTGDPAQWKGRDVLLAISRGKLDANGRRMVDPENWPADECLKLSYLVVSNVAGYIRKSGTRETTIHLHNSDWLIFTGFDTKWLTNVKRAKLDIWAQDKGVILTNSVFVDKLNAGEKFWTSGWTIYDWAEVEAVRLPTATTADGGVVRLKGSYNAVVNEIVCSLPAHKIDTTKPLYYTQGNAWVAKNNTAVRSGAVDIARATLVALSTNRVEKFKRDFPMAIEISDAAKAAAKEWASKIDANQQKAHAIAQRREHYTLKALKGEYFDDPTLSTLIRLANTNHDSYEKGLDKYGAYVDTTTKESIYKLLDGLIKTYPLAGWHEYSYPSGKTLEHTVLYLKAAIAAGKE